MTLPFDVPGAGIEARHLESGNDAVVFVFNHGEALARGDVAFRRPAGEYVARDLVDGRAVATTRTPDGVTFGVELPPGAVRVMRITRK